MMSATYISTSDIESRLARYEHTPVALSEQNCINVWWTIGGDVACLIFFAVIPPLLQSISSEWYGFFSPMGLSFLASWAGGISVIASGSALLFLPLNVVSLIALGVVLWTSQGLVQPVPEIIHWIATVATIPAGIGAVTAVAITGAFSVTFALTLLLWAVFIVVVTVLTLLALFIVGAMLGAAAR